MHTQKGFTLLLAILVTGVVLAVGLAILNITQKQFQLAGIARESEMAFQAANAGVECIRYWDESTTQGGSFDVGASSKVISCMGGTANAGGGTSGSEQNFEFDWGDPAVCTNVSVYKFHSDSGSVPVTVNGTTYRSPCPEGATCTVLLARGYNYACGDVGNRRTVERELTLVY